MPWGGMPAAVSTARTSRVAAWAACSLTLPAGTSMVTPPVPRRRQLPANEVSSARCSGVSEPRPVPIRISWTAPPSAMRMGWRSA